MSWWQRLAALTTSSTLTSELLALGISALALGAVLGIRRTLRPDDRSKGMSQVVFLVLALILGTARLLLDLVGAGDAVVTRAMGVLNTVFLGLGIALTFFQLAFDVVPGRFERRVPPIIHEVVVMAAFVFIVLGALGDAVAHNVSSVIATSAVLTAVLGLALQSTLTNLFAGLALQMDRAFGVGDWIAVGSRVGRILEIRWRSTALRTKDGDLVMVPNSKLLSEDVHNYSRPAPRHRVWLKVGIHYRHPPNLVRETLAASVRGTPGVLADPPPDSFPVEFGESSITYAVRFWIAEFDRSGDIEGEVLTRIWYGAQRAGLEIPFPIRTVHLHQDDAGKREQDAKAERKRRMAVLEAMDLFATLEPTDREMLADGLRRATYAAGQAIIEQGAPGDSMYVIERGQVRISLAHRDDTRTLATLGPGQFFGEMSLLTGEPRSASCWAMGDVECYVVDHEALRRILTASPHVADELGQVMAERQVRMKGAGADLAEAAARKAASEGLVARIRKFFDLASS